MESARDLFEEVEIEVPEGMEIPTAIQRPTSTFEGGDEAPAEPVPEEPKEEAVDPVSVSEDDEASPEVVAAETSGSAPDEKQESE
jgi:hypothetical protein